MVHKLLYVPTSERNFSTATVCHIVMWCQCRRYLISFQVSTYQRMTDLDRNSAPPSLLLNAHHPLYTTLFLYIHLCTIPFTNLETKHIKDRTQDWLLWPSRERRIVANGDLGFQLFCETASCSFCWTIVREWHRPTRPRGTVECHHLWKFGPSCFGRRNNKWWSKELFSVCLRTILCMLNDLIIFRSIGFAGECLGQHIGDAQTANLGDGSGYGRSLLCTLYSVVFLLHIHLQRTRHLKSVTILGILSSDPARKR